jgi:hypothetical protein
MRPLDEQPAVSKGTLRSASAMKFVARMLAFLSNSENGEALVPSYGKRAMSVRIESGSNLNASRRVRFELFPELC